MDSPVTVASLGRANPMGLARLLTDAFCTTDELLRATEENTEEDNTFAGLVHAGVLLEPELTLPAAAGVTVLLRFPPEVEA